jgi:DNA-binding transcriptional LysR family regulator
MDFRQLEMLEAVVTLGSITEAARQLGVTQPAVSTAMGKLERTVGFPLFRRDGRRVLPTTEARLLFGEAVRVLADFRRLGEAAAGISAAQSGTLTIATNPSPAIAWLPGIAAAFCRSRPQIRLRMLTRSSGEVRDLAALSAFDLGLAEAPFTRSEMVLRRYSFARVVVLPEGHRLVSETILTPQLLDGEALVATVNSSWSWAAVARTFEAAGAQCRVVAECEFTVIAINMVAAGMGLCLADPLSVMDAGARGLVIRPFRPTLPYDVGLLRPAHGTLTRLAEAFAAEFHVHVSPYLIENHDG